MKHLSFLTLTALLSLSACSHNKGKSCIAKEGKVSCEKMECKEEVKKSCCSDDHCKKKS